MVVKLVRQMSSGAMVHEEAGGDSAAHAQTVEGAKNSGGEGEGVAEFGGHSISLTTRSKTSGVDSPRMRVTRFPPRSTKKVVGKALTP